MTSLSPKARVYLGGVIIAGAAIVAHSAWTLWQRPPGIEAAVLVGLTIVSGLATLKLPGLPATFSISDAFTSSAAMLLGAAVGTTAAAIEGFVMFTRLPASDRTRTRLAFSVATPSIALWLSAKAFAAMVGHDGLLNESFSLTRLLLPLAVFSLLYFLLNTMLVARAVAFERGTPVLSIWREHFLRLWLSYAGGTTVAALLLALLSRGVGVRWFLIALPVPFILHFALKHAVGRVEDQMGHLAEINRLYLATIETLATAIDAKDQVTHGHIRRVQRLALRLAGELGVTAQGDLQAIEAASLLHDMGKIAVPEHILNKPGALTPAEFEVMKQHARIGAEILATVNFPYPVVPIVRHHHENWDGSGYPDGLRGEEIPIGARILSVVDCFDALTSDRPYRRAMTTRDAFAILTERSGRMYDPRVVSTFAHLNPDDAAQEPDPVEERFSSISGSVHALSESTAAADRDEDRGLTIVFELATALASTDGADRALGQIWDAVARETPLTALVVYVYEAASDSLIARYARGDDGQGIRGVRIRLGEGVSGWVAANRRPMVNSDARLDLQEHTRDLERMPASALAVPIVRDTTLEGVLTAYGTQPNQFTDRHQRLLSLAARALAVQLQRRTLVS